MLESGTQGKHAAVRDLNPRSIPGLCSGVVHEAAMPDEKPTTSRPGNRGYAQDESRALWGRHPMADWVYKPPRKGRGALPWWKQPEEER
jgi:hypothetical protein